MLSGVISGPLADTRGSVLDARGYQGPCPVLTARLPDSSLPLPFCREKSVLEHFPIEE